ncbi:MAG TPA: VOC family protein [Chitinophagaceae bacterium]
MATNIFVNLPVKDLDRSMNFFGQLGYSFNKQFTDETAACMVISDTIYAMLLTEKKFRDFIPGGKQLADAGKSTEVIIALSCESREQVEDLYRKAVAAGGTGARPPEDHGFMYLRSFNDPDGHIWEVLWMDPAAIQQQ